MKKWLDANVTDIFPRGIYDETDDALPMYYGNHNFNDYYHVKDLDRAGNDINLLGLLNNNNDNNDYDELNKNFIMQYIDSYKNIDVLIPPQTNRFHVNQLFKRMVDYTIDNNLVYRINNTKLPLIDTSIKNDFYKFCYENS